MTTPGEGDPVAELKAELAEVKKALGELAAAKTTEAKAEAREDVDDAEQDLVAAAKRAGVSVGRMKEAIAAARKQAFVDEYNSDIRSIVNDEMAKLLDEADEADKADADKVDGGAANGDKPKAAVSDQPPPAPKAEKAPDSEPVVEHWSERPIGRMIRAS